MSKISLILGPGALRGAYGAGVASVLGQRIDFYQIYGTSVGVFTATFLLTKQFDIMLDIWRNHVHGSLLINLRNPFKGRNVLDTEYLVSLFKRENSFLDLDKISREKGRLIHVLTSYISGKAEYFYPDGDNVFQSMIASSAVPYAHPAIKINDQYFYDGGISDPYPLNRALNEGNDKVIVVSNFCSNYDPKPVYRFLQVATRLEEKYVDSKKFVEAISSANPNVFLLKPSRQILHSVLDRDKDRINATVDQGIEDAEKFLKEFNDDNF